MAVHLIQFLCLISALFPSLFFALSETTCSAPLHDDRLICELHQLKLKISQLGTISFSRLIFIDIFVQSIELFLAEVFAFNVIWTLFLFLIKKWRFKLNNITESVLEESTKNLNQKSLYLKEREEAIEAISRKIHHLQSTIDGLKVRFPSQLWMKAFNLFYFLCLNVVVNH